MSRSQFNFRVPPAELAAAQEQARDLGISTSALYRIGVLSLIDRSERQHLRSLVYPQKTAIRSRQAEGRRSNGSAAH